MTKKLFSGKNSLAVVGLGYVGLPLCISFRRVFRKVIGFDVNELRVQELIAGHDKTGDISSDEIRGASVEFTHDPQRLTSAGIIVIAVPTPINSHKIPDLEPLTAASEIVGKHLSRGTTVVYESTVYPGVTEEICGPILEQFSGMKAGVDFKLGYSPERMNPGDKKHTLKDIVKVVAGQDNETTDLLAEVYGAVVEAGIHKAPDIRTAEAAKVIENVQRDLNIALVNELSIIFHRLGIDTRKVLEAAQTKWNFLPFEPGLVGGHCIGVDPYYLTFKAQEVGYHPDVILAGRRINDSMGRYIAEQTIKEMMKAEVCFTGNRILIMGIAFKENVKDIRNTRVIDIFHELREYGLHPSVFDPEADPEEVRSEYGIEIMKKIDGQAPYDGIIAAVRHTAFSIYPPAFLRSLCGPNPVLIDVKGTYDEEIMQSLGFRYWRL